MKEQLINTWPSSLDQYKQKIEKFSFNPITGIYFLFREGKLQYIGKGIDVHTRIFAHQKSKKIFDDVYCIHVESSALETIERELIRYFRPPLNIADNPDKFKKQRKQKTKIKKPPRVEVIKDRVYSNRKVRPPSINIHKALIGADSDKLVAILDTLSAIEKDITIKRYGLFGNKALTLQEIADGYKISRERVRQLQGKAERKIRHPTRWRELNCASTGDLAGTLEQIFTINRGGL
jgi:DNA-binding CsgD family transcriptional regulator